MKLSLVKVLYLFGIISLIIACKSKESVQSSISWHEKSASEISLALKEGKVTSETLTKYFIDRIQKFDKSLDINSVIVLNPDALSIAKNADKERKQGKIRGPLHGIPILIKDNIDTKDKMPNTGGSLLLKDNFPSKDAFIVSKLREAGMVLIGKTNLSEWANFRSEKSISGWSSVGLQTKNPHDISLTPCGSSAGSGAAIAAGFAPMAIGTETNGSISCPAAVNGIVGVKPTVGLLSRSGIIPISHTQDTGGPMTRSVMDAALLLTSIAGFDAADALSHKALNNDFTINCKKGYLKGKRLGVDSAYYTMSTELQSEMNNAFKALEELGAILVPVSYRKLLNSTNGTGYDVLLYEFKHGVAEYLATTKQNQYKTLADLVAGNETQKDKIMPLFGQEIFVKAQAKGPLTDTTYTKAWLDAHKKSQRVIDETLATYQLDAMIGPTLGTAWAIDPKISKGFSGPASYGFAARAGYPHVTVPMGQITHLPVGICFFGTKHSEASLLGMAYDYEQATKKIIWPKWALNP